MKQNEKYWRGVSQTICMTALSNKVYSSKNGRWVQGNETRKSLNWFLFNKANSSPPTLCVIRTIMVRESTSNIGIVDNMFDTSREEVRLYYFCLCGIKADPRSKNEAKFLCFKGFLLAFKRVEIQYIPPLSMICSPWRLPLIFYESKLFQKIPPLAAFQALCRVSLRSRGGRCSVATLPSTDSKNRCHGFKPTEVLCVTVR